MVQGTSYDYASSKVLPSASDAQHTWEKTSAKRSGYEALQRLDKEKKKTDADKKYGAWGATFKNKDNFANMHHC